MNIDKQIGHVDLLGHTDDGQDTESDVQQRVVLNRGRAETVENIDKVVAPVRLKLWGILDEKDADNAGQRRQPAHDEEERLPVVRLCKGGQRAEYDDHAQQRHDGENRFRLTTLLRHGDVRYPGVKARVVGRGAKERHHAVHHHDDDARNGDGARRADELGRVVHRDKGKGQGRKAPDKVAPADEDFALAQPVGEQPHQQRGDCGGGGAEGHHVGNHVRVPGDSVVDIDVEEHVLHRPRHLTDQAEQDQRDPNFHADLGPRRERTHCFFLFHSFSLPELIPSIIIRCDRKNSITFLDFRIYLYFGRDGLIAFWTPKIKRPPQSSREALHGSARVH